MTHSQRQKPCGTYYELSLECISKKVTEATGAIEQKFVRYTASHNPDDLGSIFVGPYDFGKHKDILASAFANDDGVTENDINRVLNCAPYGLVRDAGSFLVSLTLDQVSVGGSSVFYGRANDDGRSATIEVFEAMLPQIRVVRLAY